MIGRRALVWSAAGLALQLVVLAGSVKDCQARGRKTTEIHSKDFKKFPAGSPEAVLTALIEADLGDLHNRQDDQRFFLWWPLVEGGKGSEDGTFKLLITRYRILDAVMSRNRKQAKVALEMDVRAIWSNGGFARPGSRFSKIEVMVGADKYGLRDDGIFKDVLVDYNQAEKKPGLYAVRNEKRMWTQYVNMINKGDKWYVAIDCVPIDVSYIETLVNNFKNESSTDQAINDVCMKKSRINQRSLARCTDDEKIIYGKNIAKFMQKFCGNDDITYRNQSINEYNNTNLKLKLLAGDSQ